MQLGKLVYKVLRDIEWIQSLLKSIIGGGGLVGTVETFWADIPILGKIVIYSAGMFVVLEIFRHRDKRRLAERSPLIEDRAQSTFTRDQIYEFEKRRQTAWFWAIFVFGIPLMIFFRLRLQNC